MSKANWVVSALLKLTKVVGAQRVRHPRVWGWVRSVQRKEERTFQQRDAGAILGTYVRCYLGDDPRLNFC